MALLSKDPANLRKGGGAFLLAVPVLLWLAYDFRQEDTDVVTVLLLMAAAALVAGVLVLSRASRVRDQPSETPPRQNRVLLAVLPFGWLGFGIAYGLAEGNLLAFWLSLIPTVITASVAVYGWRHGPAR